MQYCPNCRIRIRGKKAYCPLCQRELQDLISPEQGPESASLPEPGSDDDPFVQLPAPRVSFMLIVRIVTFLCLSVEILLGAAQIISGFSSGWIYFVMLIVALGWADFRVAVFYRSNLLRMLTTQGYIIMMACVIIAQVTRSGSWALSWAVPGLFILLVAATFLVAELQEMDLHEFILYPAFDVLMSLLQIIPIAMGLNKYIAPAVICIALMLILVSSLVIFRGRMLQEAAVKFLHM